MAEQEKIITLSNLTLYDKKIKELIGESADLTEIKKKISDLENSFELEII